jgi:hypothetical protein
VIHPVGGEASRSITGSPRCIPTNPVHNYYFTYRLPTISSNFENKKMSASEMLFYFDIEIH